MRIRYYYIVLILGLMISYTAIAQETYLNPKDTMEMQYETFDTEYFEKKKFTLGKTTDYYENEDGRTVEVSNELGQGFVIKEYSPTPYFYKKVKLFYSDGELKAKGIELPKFCRIGKWMECDEEGNCQIVDYDKNMGKFDYNDVLKFLEKRGVINLKTGEGESFFSIRYSYEDLVWHISSFKLSRHTVDYILDSKTGKILKQNVRERILIE